MTKIVRNPAYETAYAEYAMYRDRYHYLNMVCMGDPSPSDISERDSVYVQYMAAQNKVNSTPQLIEKE